MAQTKRRRRKKHRGTQTGRIDARPRGRPRDRAEARSRARSRSKSSKPASRQDRPPSWRTSFYRALVAAAIFFALMLVGFGRTVVQSLALAVFMVAFYVPFGYYFDLFFYRRRQRQQQRARQEGAG